MIELYKLAKSTKRGKKRVGRGIGSGKGGHTVGRGQKGQNSRTKVALTFEGTKIKKSLLKRLPLLRGKGKQKPSDHKPLVVNLKYLNLLPEGSTVNIETLLKYKIVGAEAKTYGVKILGEGELNRYLTFEVPISGGVKRKIENLAKASPKIEEAGSLTRARRKGPVKEATDKS